MKAIREYRTMNNKKRRLRNLEGSNDQYLFSSSRLQLTYRSMVVFASCCLAAGVRTFTIWVILGAMIVTTLESDSHEAILEGSKQEYLNNCCMLTCCWTPLVEPSVIASCLQGPPATRRPCLIRSCLRNSDILIQKHATFNSQSRATSSPSVVLHLNS